LAPEGGITCESEHSPGGSPTSASTFTIKLDFVGCRPVHGGGECHSGVTTGLIETYTLSFVIKPDFYYPGDVGLFGQNAEEGNKKLARLICTTTEPPGKYEAYIESCFFIGWNSPVNESTTQIEGIWEGNPSSECYDGYFDEVTTMLSVNYGGVKGIPIELYRP
jgi:hypothetical protein